MAKTRQSVASIAALASGETSESREIYLGARLRWDECFRTNLVIEECSELILSIQHFRRGRVNEDKVAEEIADVMIMSEQARLIFGPDRVDKWKARKLKRLKERVENGKSEER